MVWVEIVNVGNLPAFKGFAASFAKHVDHYRNYFESADAHRQGLTLVPISAQHERFYPP